MQREENTENNNLLLTLQNEKSNFDETNTWRSTLAQFVAGWTICLSTVSIGMMLAFPTIAIGELHKSNQDFSLTDGEASWFGSLIFLLQPFCSILGGILQTFIGRKYGLILTYMPQVVAWLLLSSAKSVLSLYLSVALFGISAGSMEAPSISYLGEITQPRIRGKLTSTSCILFSFGYLVLYFLGSVFTWRTVAAICASVPIIAIVSVFFIPDSPIWLLNKGRTAEAMKALCWLRGWVSPDCVQFEYKNMCDYIETAKLSNHSWCIFFISHLVQNDIRNKPTYSEFTETYNRIGIIVGKPGSKSSFCKKLKKNISNLTSPAIRNPFLLITMGHLACQSAALNGMRPYLIDVLRTLQIPIKPELFTFVSSSLMICGGIICFLVIKVWGKRFTLLLSLIICSLICITLSCYTFFMDQINLPWIPMAAILLSHLATAVGLNPIPWMLTSEVFPLKGRSMSAGLAAAACYILGFAFSKTFYSLNNIIHLSGCFLLYGLCGLFCFIYLYIKLPETEGKTLAEIEEYFLVPSKKKTVDVT